MNQSRNEARSVSIGSLHAFRDITNATNARTTIAVRVPGTAVGHTASLLRYQSHGTVFSTLLTANLNSLPLDWAARFKVAGVHISFFVVKQFPILPPTAYLARVRSHAKTFVELVVPRVLELTYVSSDMASYAAALGYSGPPFEWIDSRRHVLQSELDAIYSCMYGLDRKELEWILDAQEPGVSFPTLKQKETEAFGEYRTQRLVLDAFDRITVL